MTTWSITCTGFWKLTIVQWRDPATSPARLESAPAARSAATRAVPTNIRARMESLLIGMTELRKSDGCAGRSRTKATRVPAAARASAAALFQRLHVGDERL